MPTNEQILADQARAFGDFPTEDLVIGDATYSALVLEWKGGNSFQFGGMPDSIIGRLAIERGAVATLPVQGNSASFRGGSYRVAQVDASDAGDSIKLDLEALTHE